MNTIKYRKILSFLILPLFLSFIVQYITVLIIMPFNNSSIPDFYKLFFLPQLIYPILFLAAYIAISKCLLKEDFSRLSFKGSTDFFSAAKLTVLFITASVIISTVFGKIIDLINSKETIIKPMTLSLIEPHGPVESILFIFVIAVIPAIAEETIFRGIILSNLSKYAGKFSIILSSILFALMHGNFNQIPVAFFMGLILSCYAYRYNSLLLPVVVHFFNNFFSALFQVLRCNLPEKTFTAVNLITTASFFALSFIILLFTLLKKKRNRFLEKEDSPDKEIVKESFTNICFIAYIAVNLFIAVSLNV